MKEAAVFVLFVIVVLVTAYRDDSDEENVPLRAFYAINGGSYVNGRVLKGYIRVNDYSHRKKQCDSSSSSSSSSKEKPKNKSLCLCCDSKSVSTKNPDASDKTPTKVVEKVDKQTHCFELKFYCKANEQYNIVGENGKILLSESSNNDIVYKLICGADGINWYSDNSTIAVSGFYCSAPSTSKTTAIPTTTQPPTTRAPRKTPYKPRHSKSASYRRSKSSHDSSRHSYERSVDHVYKISNIYGRSRSENSEKSNRYPAHSSSYGKSRKEERSKSNAYHRRSSYEHYKKHKQPTYPPPPPTTTTPQPCIPVTTSIPTTTPCIIPTTTTTPVPTTTTIPTTTTPIPCIPITTQSPTLAPCVRPPTTTTAAPIPCTVPPTTLGPTLAPCVRPPTTTTAAPCIPSTTTGPTLSPCTQAPTTTTAAPCIPSTTTGPALSPCTLPPTTTTTPIPTTPPCVQLTTTTTIAPCPSESSSSSSEENSYPKRNSGRHSRYSNSRKSSDSHSNDKSNEHYRRGDRDKSDDDKNPFPIYIGKLTDVQHIGIHGDVFFFNSTTILIKDFTLPKYSNLVFWIDKHQKLTPDGVHLKSEKHGYNPLSACSHEDRFVKLSKNTKHSDETLLDYRSFGIYNKEYRWSMGYVKW